MSPKKGYKLVPWHFGKEIEIPEEWEITTLKENSHITDGSHFSPPKVTKGFPMATVENLKDSSLDIDSCYNISKEDFKQLTKNNCKPEINDVLFTKDGTVGKSLVFTQNIDVVLLSSIAILKPFESLDPYFLHYSFHSEAITKFIAKFLGGTAIKRIVLKNLEKFLFPLPSLSEQQKIVTILSNVDSLIDSTSKIIKNSKSLKTGLMQKLLTKGIGHSKFKKVRLFPRYNEETIPEDWNVDRLDNLIRIMDYRGRTPLFSESGITHLRSNNIRDGQINFKDITFVSEKTYEEYMTRGIPQEDDVLFTTEGPLGEVALVPKNFKFSLAQRIIVLRPKSKIIPKFLKYLLLDRKVRTRYEGLATGTTLGGIASKWFTKLFLPYPKDISEQQQIASILINIDAQIDSQTQYKDKLERLKKSLMQKLLTGEVRVAI